MASPGLPFPLAAPMAPLRSEQIPQGSDWGYQLKWDGVRMLSRITPSGVQLFSRRLLPKNDRFPEVVRTLKERLPERDLLLDGEVVVFDPAKGRPDFHLVLQRERFRNPAAIAESGARQPAVYVLFDLLYADGNDLRAQTYRERHAQLAELFPEKTPTMFVSDLFQDGTRLWEWVEEHGWEGIVSKRLSSPYREDKKHKDWFKKKTKVLLRVGIIGLTLREGRVASLVMAKDGYFFGKVSLGLDEKLKSILLELAKTNMPAAVRAPFHPLPADLRTDLIVWLTNPFACLVTGQEITSAGVLRHPKLAGLKEDDIAPAFARS